MLRNYSYILPHNVLFLTGAPLCGKSTIASILNACIVDSAIQHMDLIRLLSENMENKKPINKRNKFVGLSSVDAYKEIGNSEYSTDNLILGYKLYSEAVSQLILSVLDKLNPEDIDHLIMEGAQLLPELTAPYLSRPGYGIIVLKTTEEQFNIHRENVFSEQNLRDKYSNEKVISIQNELIKQAEKINSKKVFIVENNGTPETVVLKILEMLEINNLIRKNN